MKTYTVEAKYYTWDGAGNPFTEKVKAANAKDAIDEIRCAFRSADILDLEILSVKESAEEDSPVSTISAALNGLDALRARVTVYVPATNGTADAADNGREVDAVASALSTWFGGATIQPGSGCWMSETCGLVKEDTTTIYAACTAEHLAEKIGDVLELCRNLKVEMKQEAIALQLDGVPGSSGLYFI